MLTLDVVHVLDRLPQPDEKTWSRSQHIAFGGPAANAAATAAALGAPSRLLAPFGQSPFTAVVAAQLQAAGVSWVDPTPQVRHPSPISTVLVTAGTGQRAVVAGGAPLLPGSTDPDGPPDDLLDGRPGDLLDGRRGDLLEDLLDELLDGVGAVLLDGHAHPWAVAVARRGRARGIPVVLDGGSLKPGTAQLLEHVDLAILSADFHVPDGADPLDWTLRHGSCRYAARSAGAAALRWRSRAGAATTEGVVPVAAVEVLDTLGAGDVLHGAAAVAVARLGLSEATLARVLGFGAGVATLSCRYAGALGWAHAAAGASVPAATPPLARLQAQARAQAQAQAQAEITRLSTQFLHTPVDDHIR
jgi:sugar/nucleoside kinase (ribokinase family)